VQGAPFASLKIKGQTPKVKGKWAKPVTALARNLR
jgi:hypothetical protein